MSIITDFILLLKDGKWYEIQEITANFAMRKAKAEMIIGFLEEYTSSNMKKAPKRLSSKPQCSNSLKGFNTLKKQECESSTF